MNKPQRDFLANHSTIQNCYSIGDALIAVCESGDLVLCQEIIAKFPTNTYNYSLCLEDALNKSCKNNHLEVAKYLTSTFPELHNECLFDSIVDTSIDVSKRSHYDILTWMIETWPYLQNTKTLSYYTMDAIEFNNKNIMQWLVDKFPSKIVIDGEVTACLNNDVDLKKYINENYRDDEFSKDLVVALCSLPTVRIVDSTILKVKLDQGVLNASLRFALENKCYDVVRWLATLSKKYSLLFETLVDICELNLLDSVKLMYELWPKMKFYFGTAVYDSNVPIDEYELDIIQDVFLNACIGGSYEMVQFIYNTWIFDKYDVNDIYDEYVRYAVFLHCLKHNDLKLVRSLHKIFEIEIDEFVYYIGNGAYFDKHENLSWMISICPTIDILHVNQNLLSMLCQTGTLKQIRNLKKRWPDISYSAIDRDAIFYAIIFNRIDVLKFIRDTDDDFFNSYHYIYENALKRCKFDIIKWLMDECGFKCTFDFNKVFESSDCCKLVNYCIDRDYKINLFYDAHLLKHALDQGSYFYLQWLITNFKEIDVRNAIEIIFENREMLAPYNCREDQDHTEIYAIISYIIKYFDIANLEIKDEYQLEFDDIIRQQYLLYSDSEFIKKKVRQLIDQSYSVGNALIKVCKKGNLELCHEIIKQFPTDTYDYDLCIVDALRKSCVNNHLDMCKYLVSIFKNLHDNCLFRSVYDITTDVIEKGNFEILMWMILEWPHLQDGNYVDLYICYARINNRKDVVLWLMDIYGSKIDRSYDDHDLFCCLNSDIDLKKYINENYTGTDDDVTILMTFCSMSTVKIVDSTILTVTLSDDVLYKMIYSACEHLITDIAVWLATLYNDMNSIFRIFSRLCRSNLINSAKFIHEIWPDMLYIYYDSDYDVNDPINEYDVKEINDVFLKVCIDNNYNFAKWIYNTFKDDEDNFQYDEYLIDVVFHHCLLHNDVKIVKFLYKIFDIEIDDFVDFIGTGAWINKPKNLVWMMALCPQLDTLHVKQNLLSIMCRHSKFYKIKSLINNLRGTQDFSYGAVNRNAIRYSIYGGRLDVLKFMDQTDVNFSQYYSFIFKISLRQGCFNIIQWLSSKCDISKFEINYNKIFFTDKCHILALYLTDRNKSINLTYDKNLFEHILPQAPYMFIEWIVRFFSSDDVANMIEIILKHSNKYYVSFFDVKCLITSITRIFDIDELVVKEKYQSKFDGIMHQILLERSNIKSASKK